MALDTVTSVTRWEILFAQNLPIYNTELYPKSKTTYLPKQVRRFVKYLINPPEMAEHFKKISKVAKVRQIWSH